MSIAARQRHVDNWRSWASIAGAIPNYQVAAAHGHGLQQLLAHVSCHPRLDVIHHYSSSSGGLVELIFVAVATRHAVSLLEDAF